MSDNSDDEYSLWRTAPDAARLCYLHFLWRELHKANIHPSIKLDDSSDVHILDVAAGHCIWAMQVAEEYPKSHVVASDIDLGLCPPKSELPQNLSIKQWNIFDEVPDEWREAFDMIHVRLLVQPFSGHKDLRPVLEKFVSMLKPGGCLQWGEYNYEDVNSGHVYALDNPEKVPDADVSHPASINMWRLMHSTFEWPIEHFAKLDQYYRDAGLVEVKVDRVRPPSTVFRAFHEHWFAICAQLVPILDKKGVGSTVNQLLHEIRRGAAEDGVFSAHIAKFVIGRKPVQIV